MDVEHHKSGHIGSRPTVVIPPRKLLSSVKSPSSALSPRQDKKDICYDSDSDDPYAGDHFRIYEFKIRRCTRSRSHDWTDCPFSHPGEKARRRDPRRYHYTSEVCPEFRNGGDCSRGDECGFAHGVFECWLHPNRYRTEACKDGKHCKRKVCFFAHSPRQLRVLPPPPPESFISGGRSAASSPSSVLSNKMNRCCLFCSHSPTSTLLGLSRSPSSSPPQSPADKAAAFSRLSRCRSASAGYKELVLNELINSLDSFSLTEALAASSSPVSTAAMLSSSNISNHHHRLPPWLDVGDRDLQLQHSSSLQFAPSPSTPSYLHSQPQLPPQSFFSDEFATPRGGRLSDFTAAATAAAKARVNNSFDVGSSGDLDLGWVNDLLT